MLVIIIFMHLLTELTLVFSFCPLRLLLGTRRCQMFSSMPWKLRQACMLTQVPVCTLPPKQITHKAAQMQAKVIQILVIIDLHKR